MIVHNIKIGKETSEYWPIRENKKIYVGSAKSDIRYRDILVNGRHRWELYSKPSIDFSTFDRKEWNYLNAYQSLKKRFGA